MADLHLSPKAADALWGKDHVLVLGPRAALAGKPAWIRALKLKWLASIPAMAADAAPGGLGKVLTTWPAGGRPSRLTVGLLPDATSRHVSPSRAHAIAACAEKAEIHGGEKTGVLLVLDDASHVLAAANAASRALRLYDARSRKRRAVNVTVAAILRDGSPVAIPAHAADVIASARWAASMTDRPTSDLDSARFVEEAKALVKDVAGARVRVIAGEALLQARLGGLHAVGRAATVAPRLLILEHAPKGAKKTLALVGKGIVYDTGGLALKPRDAMVGMKGDMAGGAAVVGAFRVLASRFAHRLLALVPLAENAIGPSAYRNDDILTLHSGRTVEVNNTDAEGRIVLADAASFAARELGASLVIDAATLTGAQLVATGRRHAAIVASDDELEKLAVASGLASGDLVHPLPFAPELFQRELRSDLADMRNSVKDRSNAQSSCAAQFIWAHLDGSGARWLHVDMAGPADHEGRGTGYGVALLSEIVSRLE